MYASANMQIQAYMYVSMHAHTEAHAWVRACHLARTRHRYTTHARLDCKACAVGPLPNKGVRMTGRERKEVVYGGAGCAQMDERALKC